MKGKDLIKAEIDSYFDSRQRLEAVVQKERIAARERYRDCDPLSGGIVMCVLIRGLDFDLLVAEKAFVERLQRMGTVPSLIQKFQTIFQKERDKNTAEFEGMLRKWFKTDDDLRSITEALDERVLYLRTPPTWDMDSIPN